MKQIPYYLLDLRRAALVQKEKRKQLAAAVVNVATTTKTDD